MEMEIIFFCKQITRSFLIMEKSKSNYQNLAMQPNHLFNISAKNSLSGRPFNYLFLIQNVLWEYLNSIFFNGKGPFKYLYGNLAMQPNHENPGEPNPPTCKKISLSKF